MKGTTNFRCAFQNKCVITRSNRRQCQSCRLKKCLSIGMLKELIMSDEAVEKRRMLIRRKRLAEEPVDLSPEQKEIIQELINAHRKTFDMTFSNFRQFRPLDRHQNPIFEYSNENLDSFQPVSGAATQRELSGEKPCMSSLQSENTQSSSEKGKKFTSLPHFTDLGTYMIQNVISFAKLLKPFRALTIEDQISLLKGAAVEVTILRFNMLFNEKLGIWECGTLKYCINDVQRAGFQPLLLDPLKKLHYTMRRLHLEEEEYVLMGAISLFSPVYHHWGRPKWRDWECPDRPGVTHHKVIDQLQERFALTLKTYIDAKRKGPEKDLIYPKIMACLTEMRTVNEEHSKQILQIQDIQPEVSPLLLEIVRTHS